MNGFMMGWRDCAAAKEAQERGARTWLLAALHGENPDVNAIALLFVLGLFVWGCVVAAWMVGMSDRF